VTAAPVAGYSTPPAAAGFSGAIFNATTGGTKLNDLGLSCLYVGGAGNTSTAPNANPDGPTTVFGVSSCSGAGNNTLNLAGNNGSGAVAANGNGWGGNPIGVDCSFGPYVTKHCTVNNAICTSDTDCGGAAGSCNPDPRCIFGPPLPVPAGPTSTCVLNVIRVTPSGTVDKAAGSSNITLPLSSYIFLTGNTDKYCRNGAAGNVVGSFGKCTNDAGCGAGSPLGTCAIETACPTCDNAVTLVNHCISGPNHGQACTPVGLKKTSPDCLPSRDGHGALFIGPLGVDLAPLGTGTTTLTSVVNPARSSQSFFCPVGGASSCTYTSTFGSTCQQTQGCFGNASCKRIEQTGSPAGSLADNLPHDVTISAVFCIPASGNPLVDGGSGADLPGPGAVSIRGTFQTVP
jgi:hypothetical protein